MPEIAPFRAVRFDHDHCGGDLSAVIAPPYDVLDPNDKAALLLKSDRNIVALDLPHLPPKSAGPPEVYQRSAKMLDDWLGDGTLVREERPALYLYHQCFEHDGRPYTRRMFIARVRLTPFSDGSVLPHENTFGGPKKDRLALMKTTRCQLSPIFGIYRDPTDAVGAVFASTATGAPDVTGRLDRVENRVWIVSDPSAIAAVVSVMAEKRVYIADGHHRYGTALLYRDWLEAEAGGPIAENHAANWIMFVLASMDDSGCLILPYNRVLAGIDATALLGAWAEGVEPSGPDRMDMVLFDGRTRQETPVRFTSRDALGALAPEECDAWRRLDYAYLHRYLIDELLSKSIGRDLKVLYVKSAEAAKRVAESADGVALLMRATPMEILRRVSEAGGLMPQKSTYFYPKLATGLAVYPLTTALFDTA